MMTSQAQTDCQLWVATPKPVPVREIIAHDLEERKFFSRVRNRVVRALAASRLLSCAAAFLSMASASR
jgi:hypothetical protein